MGSDCTREWLHQGVIAPGSWLLTVGKVLHFESFIFKKKANINKKLSLIASFSSLFRFHNIRNAKLALKQCYLFLLLYNNSYCCTQLMKELQFACCCTLGASYQSFFSMPTPLLWSHTWWLRVTIRWSNRWKISSTWNGRSLWFQNTVRMKRPYWYVNFIKTVDEFN